MGSGLMGSGDEHDHGDGDLIIKPTPAPATATHGKTKIGQSGWGDCVGWTGGRWLTCKGVGESWSWLVDELDSFFASGVLGLGPGGEVGLLAREPEHENPRRLPPAREPSRPPPGGFSPPRRAQLAPSAPSQPKRAAAERAMAGPNHRLGLTDRSSHLVR